RSLNPELIHSLKLHRSYLDLSNGESRAQPRRILSLSSSTINFITSSGFIITSINPLLIFIELSLLGLSI
ncbi:unnamed protein product, partial [Brassica oleracea]